MKSFRYLSSALVIAFAATGFGQVVITQWDFNGPSTGAVPGGTSNPLPAIGTGTASLLGTTATFASGAASGGSSDPAGGAPPNYAWNTTTYAAQSTLNGERGVQFDVATTGFTDIKVTFDTRHSNTASKWLRFDYTTDGSTWVLGSAATNSVFEATAGDSWFNGRSVDLSGVTAVNNNANFAFRVVAIFGPETGPFDDSATYVQYWASNSSSSYAATGTLRYDMVTVEGVPEPGTMAALAIGGLGLLARRRRAAKQA